MAEVIIMPKLGFNMKKGKLIKWYKKEGDKVKKGENFFQITTDKTNIDIEATKDGIVRKIMGEEGEEYEVFESIAIIGQADEDISELLENKEIEEKNEDKETKKTKLDTEESSKKIQESKSENKEKMIKISPRANKYMQDNNLDIDLKNVLGTGYDNGIKEEDIIKYQEDNEVNITPVARNLAEINNLPIDQLVGTGARGKITKEDVEKAISDKEKQQKELIYQEADESKKVLKTSKYEGVRKIIGDRLAQSKSEAPHVYFKNEVDMTEILELKKQIESKNNNKVSLTDFITLAVSKALQRYTEINVSLVEDEIIEYESINIGIAVAADDGLIVPVIKNAQGKTLSSLSKETKELVKKAKDGKLIPEDYSGGTITISNLGMFGIDEFTAVINPPESAILAVSSMKDKPVVVIEKGEKVVRIRPMTNIVLSVDHRIIDGLLASQFIKTIKELLENPLELLI